MKFYTRTILGMDGVLHKHIPALKCKKDWMKRAERYVEGQIKAVGPWTEIIVAKEDLNCFWEEEL